MNITRLNQNLFAVDSESTDRSYTVNLQAKSCSCPHHQFREAHCKHLQAVEQHVAALAAPQSALDKAAAKAALLTDEQLRLWAAQYESGPVAGACRLELAARLNARQADNQPVVDLAAHTCTCREFTERRDGKRIGVLVVTCRHLQAAKTEPKPIPAAAECFLEGATAEERERALAVYR